MLARHGVPATRLGALGRSDSPILEGWRIERFDAELIYRTVSASEILIIRYRRLASAHGLRNPFRCFEWFHRLLREHRHETGITFGFGIIDTRMFRADGGIDDDTLTRIYRDLMGGLIVDSSRVPGLSPLERELYRRTNTRWVCQHFEHYTTAREHRARQRHAAARAALSGS